MIKLAIIGILVLIVITVNVGYYLELSQIRNDIKETYKDINNLLCDYEDELDDLSEVLKMYHELMNDYQIPMIAPVEFTEWMEAGKPIVNNDDW
jgi:hypothetical protein